MEFIDEQVKLTRFDFSCIFVRFVQILDSPADGTELVVGSLLSSTN